MHKRLENGLVFIFTISLIATFGSLYFSEVRGYEPCTLCWYQRILMYPIVLITGIALIPEKRKNRIDDSCVFDCRRFHFALSLWNPETELFTRKRTSLW